GASSTTRSRRSDVALDVPGRHRRRNVRAVGGPVRPRTCVAPLFADAGALPVAPQPGPVTSRTQRRSGRDHRTADGLPTPGGLHVDLIDLARRRVPAQRADLVGARRPSTAEVVTQRT